MVNTIKIIINFLRRILRRKTPVEPFATTMAKLDAFCNEIEIMETIIMDSLAKVNALSPEDDENVDFIMEQARKQYQNELVLSFPSVLNTLSEYYV